MMNLAFYIEELNNSEFNQKVYSCLNSLIDENKIRDASLFVDNINFMDKQVQFGIFNSTELWNYTGILVTTRAYQAFYVNKIVNKFKQIFYAGHKEENLLSYIDIVLNVPSFVINEIEQKEALRVTGKLLPIIDLNNILEAIKYERNRNS
jgi:hypothetical protein